MALTWPENPRLIGTKVPRLDGLAKASGRAKYPSDIRPEGTLFAVMLYSPHAHAKIKSIDTSAAEKLPGVKAVVAIAKEGTTLRYQGDDIAAVAAETEEQARDAVRAIKVEYEVLPHVVTEPQAMAPGAPEVFKGGNVRKGRAQTKGKPDEAMAKADATIEGTYSAAGHHPRLPRAPRPDRQVGRPRQADGLGEHAGGAGGGRRAGRHVQHPRGQRHGAHRGTWEAASAPSSGPTSGAGQPPSWPRRPAGRSSCSSTGSRSTWRPAIARARRARSSWGRRRTARSSP